MCLKCIFVVIHSFLKMINFIPYKKAINTSIIDQLFFLKMVCCMRSLLKIITFDQDNKFLSHFKWLLWRMYNSSWNFSSTSFSQTARQIESLNWKTSNSICSICGDKLKLWDVHSHKHNSHAIVLIKNLFFFYYAFKISEILNFLSILGHGFHLNCTFYCKNQWWFIENFCFC
jgi:hypothetical protein